MSRVKYGRSAVELGVLTFQDSESLAHLGDISSEPDDLAYLRCRQLMHPCINTIEPFLRYS